MSKRKNFYRDYHEKEFNSVWELQLYIDLESIGKVAISAHNATQKHKDSARQTKST